MNKINNPDMPTQGLLMGIVHTSLEMIIMAAKNLTEITMKKVSKGPHIVTQGNLVRDQEVEAATINLIETEAIRDTADQREEIRGHPTATLLEDMTTLKIEVQILTKVLPAQAILDKVILRTTVEIDDPTNVETISKETQAIDPHHPEGIILLQRVKATLDLT